MCGVSRRTRALDVALGHGAFVVLAEGRYRLRDGTEGTEYQACLEAVRRLEAERRYIEERIELLRLRMQTAAGAP